MNDTFVLSTPFGTRPPAMFGHSVTMDPTNGKLYVFGGVYNDKKEKSIMWSLDYQTYEWYREWDDQYDWYPTITTVSAKPRYHHAAAFYAGNVILMQVLALYTHNAVVVSKLAIPCYVI